MRIGVFGGSFDPVHNAHLIVARLAAEQLQLEQVLFVVAGAQPHKHGGHAASAEQRLAMVRLATAGIADFVVDDRELRRPPPSYTIDTLRELAAEHLDAELVLIMGEDVAAHLGGWRNPDGVRALARIAVCRRAESGSGLQPAAWTTGADLEIEVPALAISSTAVRARAAYGRSLAGWVPPSVADYIVASQIYVE